MKGLATTALSAFLSATVLLAAGSMQPAKADVLLSGWDGAGESGFGELALERNDDGSSAAIAFDSLGDLAFDDGVNFFGTSYSAFFINNNGNITFNGGVSSFTPNPFPISAQPMIAPFWADVDTRCADCGSVYIGSPNAETLVVTWDAVGSYNQNATQTNTFQLVLIDRSDTNEDGTTGNFDVEFRYDDINWTSGSASDGVPAQAGYDAGDGTNFFTVPGSRTDAIADIDIADSNTGTPGIWTFAIRDGALPGETPTNPILPIVNPSTPTDYNFEFEIITPDVPIFIDPDVAVGYDYIVNSGPLITSVLLPTGFDDNLFDLWLWENGMWVDAGVVITGGETYTFASAVDRFRILGIDTSEMVDPTDTQAFVTGLTFDSAGTINMNQNAITVFVPDVPTISAPSTIAFILSFGVMILVRRRFAK